MVSSNEAAILRLAQFLRNQLLQIYRSCTVVLRALTKQIYFDGKGCSNVGNKLTTKHKAHHSILVTQLRIQVN